MKVTYLLVLALPVSASTYHVAITGSDTVGNGSAVAPWKTIQKAVNSVAAGDTIEVGAGTFAGFEIKSANGTSDSRITVNGQGTATIINSQVLYRKPYWTVKNVKFIGYTVQRARVRFELFAHNCELLDFTMDNEYKLYHPGIEFATGGNTEGTLANAFSPDQPRNCRVAGGDISHVKGQICIRLAGTANIVENCVVHDCVRVDFLRVWGERNIIRDSQFLRNMPVPEGEEVGFHADFVQTFGNNGDGSRGHVFERLFVKDVYGQISQLVEGTSTSPELIGTGALGDWTFRNCIFSNVSLGASLTIPGVKFYNCVFYENGGGLTTSNSTDRGSAVGWRIKNCVFLDIGELDRNNSGWYGVPDPTKPGYYSDWEADYNFVAKNNFAPVRESTTGEPIAYRWWEDHGINGGDPGFVDAEAGDFRLRADSPLIGRGIAIEGVTDDFAGNPRPQSAPDIGAFQYINDDVIIASPSAPEGLKLFPVRNYQVNLLWRDRSDNENGFFVFRSLRSGSGFDLISIAKTNVTGYTDMGLLPGLTYYYKVCAYNDGGMSSFTNEASVVGVADP